MGSEVSLICTENSIQKIIVLPECVRLREGGTQSKVTQLFADVFHLARVNTLMTEGTYITVLFVQVHEAAPFREEV
jgi:hypothetical protein